MASGRVFGYTSNGIKSSWRFMVQKLGIENLHFHDLRHEAVSRLFEKGTLDMMEISAISGHKSLAMLKRYTHLKAQKLVRKLEAPKNQARAAVLNCIVPYPAEVIKKACGNVSVRLLDFTGVHADSYDLPAALELAQSRLLKTIILSIKHGRPLPAPDQYLEMIPQDRIVLIDPLSEDDADMLDLSV